jgi:hypothetical protein
MSMKHSRLLVHGDIATPLIVEYSTASNKFYLLSLYIYLRPNTIALIHGGILGAEFITRRRRR